MKTFALLKSALVVRQQEVKQKLSHLPCSATSQTNRQAITSSGKKVEKLLLDLLVNLRPRIEEQGHTHPDFADIMAKLESLATVALTSHSLRVLDCLNYMYEVCVDGSNAQQADDNRYASFLELYNRALIRWIDRDATFEVPQLSDGKINRKTILLEINQPLRVAVVSSAIDSGLAMLNEINEVEGVDAFLFLTIGRKQFSKSKMAHVRFMLLQIARMAYGIKQFPTLLQAILRRRIVICMHHIASKTTTVKLRDMKFDVGIHGCDTIYRKHTISEFRLGILNAHIGILPEYRGRAVAEWSILNGHSNGITTFFIDEGIDTGLTYLLRERTIVNETKSVIKLKQKLFKLRFSMCTQALKILTKDGKAIQLESSEYPRYFVMSHLLTSVANQLVAL